MERCSDCVFAREHVTDNGIRVPMCHRPKSEVCCPKGATPATVVMVANDKPADGIAWAIVSGIILLILFFGVASSWR